MFNKGKEETTENKNEVSEKENVGTAEKARKIAIGATVGGVLLTLFLVIILIIQFVQMGVKNAKKRSLDNLIEQQKEQLAGEEEDLDFLTGKFGLLWEALDYGYKYKN